MPFTHSNFAELLNKYNYNIQIGDIIAGTIFSKEKQGYLVDIGVSIAAYLPEEEILISKKKHNNLELNMSQEFFILTQNPKTNRIILSTKRLLYIRGWARIQQISKEDIAVKAIISRINKGGLLVHLENIQGFIPQSHLCYLNKIDILNTTIWCKCLITNEQTNQLILSNRSAILEQQISQIKIGTILNAEIMEIKSYGAFVSIYNIPALLHISEIEKDKEYSFFIGQIIPVRIIHIDIKQGRLSVSRRYF